MGTVAKCMWWNIIESELLINRKFIEIRIWRGNMENSLARRGKTYDLVLTGIFAALIFVVTYRNSSGEGI